MPVKKGNIPWNKKEIDIVLMKKLYYEDLWDYRKIAKFFGFKSRTAIGDRFKVFGLKARNNIDLKTGLKHSKETRLKISKAGMGRKHTVEFKRKLSERVRGKGNPMYGKIPHNYKGNYVDQNGYQIINVKGESISEHRHNYKQEIGYISAGNIIHHINNNRLDNRIENLKCITRSEHSKIHCSEFNRNNINGQFQK